MICNKTTAGKKSVSDSWSHGHWFEYERTKKLIFHVFCSNQKEKGYLEGILFHKSYVEMQEHSNSST